MRECTIKNMKGNITIFLSLSLTVCIALICTTLESARLKGVLTHLDMAADSAVDSLFAEYDRYMLEQYGLLFLDAGFGTKNFSEEALTGEIESYLQYELIPSSEQLFSGTTLYPIQTESISVFNLVKPVDYGGSMFAQSVVDYMKYAGVGDILEKITGWKDIIAKSDDNSETIKQAQEIMKNPSVSGTPQNESSHINNQKGGGQHAIDQKIENPVFMRSIQKEEARNDNCPNKYNAFGKGDEILLSEETEEEKEDQTEPEFDKKRYDEEVEKSVIHEAENLKKGGFLKLVIPADQPISAAKLSTETLPSVTAGQPLSMTNKNTLEIPAREILYDEYLIDKFPCFTTKAERTGIQYELEYILFGKDSDEENLKAAVNRLILIREGLNLAHILASPEKMEASLGMAAALVGWTLLPPLVTAAQLVIAGVWAYGETLLDIKSLLEGKKVSLVKNDANWRLGLSGLMDFLKGSAVETTDDSEGISYEDYLRVLSFIQDRSEKYYHTMDMIQVNMQKVKPEFLMKNCIYGLEAIISVKAKSLFLSLPIVADTIKKESTGYVLSSVAGKNY